jgi:hypothetical protein
MNEERDFFNDLKIGKVIWRLANLTYGFLEVEITGLNSVKAVCDFNKAIKNGFVKEDGY